ncbi:hypothetical protein ABGT15_08805 [Flavobacterium enshiense]|uniref:hypothetical protein n=1 Tax=Flavobacterium enshiense TaxID=1341165 RepID=UPI00345D91A6
MTTSTIQNQTNWFTKFIISFLGLFGFGNSLLTFIPLIPDTVEKAVIPIVVAAVFSVFLIASIVFSLYWHKKEKNKTIDSETYKTWLIALLRYWIAFQMTSFAFSKFFEVQFGISYIHKDTPLSMLSGNELTWSYFGYSYVLSFIIGIIQLGGGILLLFRRTILLGTAILFPLMFNILLINFFYLNGPGAYITAVLTNLGLCYLLFLYKDEILTFFLTFKNESPGISNTGLKTVGKIMSIATAALFVTYFSFFHVNAPKNLHGKWNVTAMTRNGKNLDSFAWIKDTTAWKNIYFEERNQLLLCPNPYAYIDSVSIFMKYNYDDEKKSMNVIAFERGTPDTIPVDFKQNKDHISWKMVLYKDTIQMELKKVKI